MIRIWEGEHCGDCKRGLRLAASQVRGRNERNGEGGCCGNEEKGIRLTWGLL